MALKRSGVAVPGFRFSGVRSIAFNLINRS